MQKFRRLRTHYLRRQQTVWAFAVAASVLSADLALAEADEPVVQTKPGITAGELSALKNSSLFKQLKQPIQVSTTPAAIEQQKRRALKAFEDARTVAKKGDSAKAYDVVIQIGHFPRTAGRTGGVGKYVSEQQMAAFVALGIANKLKTMKTTAGGDPKTRRPISYLIIPADGYVGTSEKLNSQLFISLHTDAPDKTCTVGPSVGFQRTGDAKGMHGIALALAISLELDADKFMRDNYTENLSGYYAYKTIDTKRFKGVLEMSELTCQQQEVALLTRADVLAANLATAIQFALR